MIGNAKYDSLLREALGRRGFPADIGAAFRAAHGTAYGARLGAIRRVREAQAEAHRLATAPS